MELFYLERPPTQDKKKNHKNESSHPKQNEF
jgi:hypothetical protein